MQGVYNVIAEGCAVPNNGSGYKHSIILAEEMEAPYVNMKKMASFAYRQVKLERKLIKVKENAQKRKKHAKEVNVNYLVFVYSLDNVQR